MATQADVTKVKGKVHEKGHAHHGRVGGRIINRNGNSRPVTFTNINTGSMISRDSATAADKGWGIGKGATHSVYRRVWVNTPEGRALVLEAVRL